MTSQPVQESTVVGIAHRAGVLEQDSVRLLTDTGFEGRVLTHGSEHQGIELLIQQAKRGHRPAAATVPSTES